MAGFTGFAYLQKPSDLLKKLEHDFSRLQSDRDNPYVAFDFFVTAEHIIDWINPTDPIANKGIREGNALLKAVSHIANGAKHFHATNRRHKSIEDVEIQHYVEPGYVAEGYIRSPLIVRFTASEALALGEDQLEVVQLAERVLNYWRAQGVP